MPNAFHLSMILACISPVLSTEKQFIQFESSEYYIERNNAAKNYPEAVRSCNKSQAILAIVNKKAIRDFLVKEIENITGK